jgi:hypothetical protein
LITADFINAMLDALNYLEARLSVVEARLAKKARASGPRRQTAKRKRNA